jgi:asparagine synthase (glutamine-hydrolysing)
LGAIVGLFAFDGRPVAAEIERMRGAAFIELSPPLCGSSDRRLWFDGRLDNRSELTSRASLSDAEVVMSLYEQRGDRFVSALNGDFALALLDNHRRQLILSRDVMASRPLYYCPVAGAVLFASEIKCLLAHQSVVAAPDEDALAELVLDSWCDEHRTCFKGIYSVSPGQSVIVRPDRIDRRIDWSFDPSNQIRYRSFAEYREHFRTLFEQSVRRRMRSANGVAVSVSGGLDSSSILCQAAAVCRRETMHVRLHGISMTFAAGTPADEEHFLPDIERMYDLRIARVPVRRYSYIDRADATVRDLDTPEAVEDTQLQIRRIARAAGCEVLLSGFFGDQMLADRSYFVDLARRGRWFKLRHDLREFAAWNAEVDPRIFRRDFWRSLVRALPPHWAFQFTKRALRASRAKARYPPWFTPTFRQRAIASASRRFREPRRFATAHTRNCFRHATAGHYLNIVRREQAAAAVHGVEVRYPYRDRDLVAFLMAIPGEIVNWQGVPKGLLRHALTGVLPESIRDRRWKADFTALENDAARHDARRVLGMLHRDCLAVRTGFIDAGALNRLEAACANLTSDESALPGWRPTDLAGLELWLQQFFSTAAAAN